MFLKLGFSNTMAEQTDITKSISSLVTMYISNSVDVPLITLKRIL